LNLNNFKIVKKLKLRQIFFVEDIYGCGLLLNLLGFIIKSKKERIKSVILSQRN